MSIGIASRLCGDHFPDGCRQMETRVLRILEGENGGHLSRSRCPRPSPRATGCHELARHLWARRYDCELKDVFDVRDDVTQSIAGTLLGDEGQLMRSEIGRSLTKNTARLDAYDYLLRGIHEEYKFTKESNFLARRYYE